MLASTVRDYLLRVPFVSFVVQMNGGGRYAIPHPDFAHVSPKGSAVTVYSDGDGALTLSSLLVESVEDIPREVRKKRRASQ